MERIGVRRLTSGLGATGGGIRDGFVVVVVTDGVVFIVSVGLVCVLGGRGGGGGEARDVDCGGGGGRGGVARNIGILLFSVKCTGSTRATGTGVGRDIVSVTVGDVVVLVVVVLVEFDALVHGDGICVRVAVGGRSKSTVTLSTLFARVELKLTGSVTIILCDDVLGVIESTDAERTVVDDGV